MPIISSPSTNLNLTLIAENSESELKVTSNGRSFIRKTVDLFCAATVVGSVSTLAHLLFTATPSKPGKNSFKNNPVNQTNTNSSHSSQAPTIIPTNLTETSLTSTLPLSQLVLEILGFTSNTTAIAETNLTISNTELSNANLNKETSSPLTELMQSTTECLAQINLADFSILNSLVLPMLISIGLVSPESTITDLATIDKKVTALTTLLNQSTEIALSDLSPGQVQLIEQFALSLGMDPTSPSGMETAIALIGDSLTQLSLSSASARNGQSAQCLAYRFNLADLSFSNSLDLPQLSQFISTALTSLKTITTNLVAISNPTTSLATVLNQHKKVALSSGQLKLIEQLTVTLGMIKSSSDMGTGIAFLNRAAISEITTLLSQRPSSIEQTTPVIVQRNSDATLSIRAFSNVIASALLAMNQNSSKKE